MTFLKFIGTAVCVALLLITVTGSSTMIELPAEMKIRQTLFGKFKIFAGVKESGLPNEVNRVSVMLYGEEGQSYKRENILCPCGVECRVDSILIQIKMTLIGVWDRRLDNCEKAPRGEYSVHLIGPVEQDDKSYPVVYGHASITLR